MIMVVSSVHCTRPNKCSLLWLTDFQQTCNLFCGFLYVSFLLCLSFSSFESVVVDSFQSCLTYFCDIPSISIVPFAIACHCHSTDIGLDSVLGLVRLI